MKRKEPKKIAPMLPPAVSGWYAIDEKHCREPVYLPTPEEIRHEAERIKQQTLDAGEVSTTKYDPGNDDTRTPGIRCCPDHSDRMPILMDGYELCDSEYWNQRS